MMLDHLKQPELAAKLMNAVVKVLSAKEIRTPDIGGKSTTTEVTDAVIAAL
jgi:tartrate dehydrogenase/decarboxylase/D-malate dehydrogenase